MTFLWKWRVGQLTVLPVAVMMLTLVLAEDEAASQHCAKDQVGDCPPPHQPPSPPGPPPRQCQFRTMTASEYAAHPIPWNAWTVPVLVAGASTSSEEGVEGGWDAPFLLLKLLLNGSFDDTVVSVGPAAGAGMFDGSPSNAQLLSTFRATMTTADALFDTQNSAAGRHIHLPIPGVAATKGDQWYNVLSVGAAGAGLPLHAHGAAWLALGKGRKEWVAFPPGHELKSKGGSRDGGGTSGASGASGAGAGDGVGAGVGAAEIAPAERPALEGSAAWFDAMADTIRSGGSTATSTSSGSSSSSSDSGSSNSRKDGLRCTQESGTVVLLPAGWAHATLNSLESWAVGRQRLWDPTARLDSIEPFINPVRPSPKQVPPLSPSFPSTSR
jgi:hypothetical protein